MQIAFYNAMGMKMQTLATGVQTAGVHTINADLNGLKSGVYFCKLISNGAVLVIFHMK